MTAVRVRRFACPHCDSPSFKEDSRRITRLVRDEYFRCTDEAACGFRFKVQLEVVSVLRQSKKPRPWIVLTFTAARPIPKVMPEPANDVHQVGAAATG